MSQISDEDRRLIDEHLRNKGVRKVTASGNDFVGFRGRVVAPGRAAMKITAEASGRTAWVPRDQFKWGSDGIVYVRRRYLRKSGLLAHA